LAGNPAGKGNGLFHSSTLNGFLDKRAHRSIAGKHDLAMNSGLFQSARRRHQDDLCLLNIDSSYTHQLWRRRKGICGSIEERAVDATMDDRDLMPLIRT